MDKQLAAIYGTGQVEYEEDDLEKTAAAELLVKLAEEEGVDLSQFSDEDVEGMINELYSGDGIEHTAEAEEELDEEGQEKFAEADFLGRVMAHSMVQELNNIEKEAAEEMGPQISKARLGYRRAKGAVQRGASAAGKATGVSQMIEGLKDVRKAKGMQAAETAAGHAKRSLKAFPSGKAGVEALKGGAKRFGKRVGIPLALAGGGYAAYRALKGKKKEKNASALEKLAEARAYEMLMESGYLEIPEGYEQEKLAGQLGYEVDNLALQMLEAAGWPVEWNE
jgi:transcriptional regulator with XRE-family HTH domain